MPVYRLFEKANFPPVNLARKDGLLAFGGNLEPNFIIEAYSRGIFPWYNEDEPVLWWSPNPRSVFFLDNIKISKSMKKFIKKNEYRVSFDENFEGVINSCAKSRKETWISKDFIKTYTKLHLDGIAHSVEVWKGEELVGGLYGINLGKMFYGESMFSLEANTSKLALISLANFLKERDYKIIDCQVHNSHLESIGAVEISREEFLKIMKNQIEKNGEYGKWNIKKATD